MSSFLNIFGGSEEDTGAGGSADEVVIDIEEGDMGESCDIVSPIGSVIETGTKWAKDHPVFILWGIVAIAGLVYLAYFRNTDPEDQAVEEALLGKNTDELMDDLELDLNLTKQVKGEHLTVSTDNDEASEASEESEDNKEEEQGKIRMNELSDDLNELAEYTQESMDI